MSAPGERAPSDPHATGLGPIDLEEAPRNILRPDDPALTAAPPADAEGLAARLAACLGMPGARLCASGAAARERALEHARRSTGREGVLAWSGVGGPPPPEGALVAATLEELGSALDAEPEPAALFVEPWPELPALTALVDRARERGARIVFDETDTAFRAAPGPAARALGREPDLVVVGESLAAGRPFGAVLGDAPRDDAYAPPSPEALAALAATLNAVEGRDLSASIARQGEALRSAFAEECREQAIEAELVGPPARLAFRFRDQEGAPAERIGHHFLLELRDRGVLGGEVMRPDPWLDEADVARATEALRGNVRRLRNLLIEHNSWFSGGLAWVFGSGEPLHAERGLAIYRYPRLGRVRVTAEEQGVRIAFAPGSLGEVTSCGFYAPTFLTGDFEVTARYRLETWRPGADTACFGLFAQDRPALRRYYAQRASDGADGDDHVVRADLVHRLGPPRPAGPPEGELRLRRSGAVVSAWHRSPGGEWQLLDERDDDPGEDLHVGAKIWGKVDCEGLVVLVTELRVRGRPAASQPPLDAPVADPLDESGPQDG